MTEREHCEEVARAADFHHGCSVAKVADLIERERAAVLRDVENVARSGCWRCKDGSAPFESMGEFIHLYGGGDGWGPSRDRCPASDVMNAIRALKAVR